MRRKFWLLIQVRNVREFKMKFSQICHLQGLTYTQICNWFANWRRKLKNTSEQKKPWGSLIKNYNFSARGNVEQFSICSSDSIWEDPQRGMDSLGSSSYDESEVQDFMSQQNAVERKFRETSMHGESVNGNFIMSPDSPFFQSSNFLTQSQCFQISSTTSEMAAFHVSDQHHQQQQLFCGSNSTKFKNHIMEKYLRGLDEASSNSDNNNSESVSNNNLDSKEEVDPTKKPELSKWLESTANFTPSDYNVDFRRNEKKSTKSMKQSSPSANSGPSLCEKELLAAETLVLLKNNFRTKFYNS